MAKVSPYYGRNKFNWKLRLSTLITAMGSETLAQAEENASSAKTSVIHRGARLVIAARKLRGGYIEHYVAIYSNEGHFTYLITTKPKAELHINRPDDQIVHKDHYKRLERLVYRCFAPHRSSEIMSRGDDRYNWSLDHE